LPHRRGPDQFALLDAFVRRAAKPKTLSIITYFRSSSIVAGDAPAALVFVGAVIATIGETIGSETRDVDF
jgi:hypothetical protein